MQSCSNLLFLIIQFATFILKLESLADRGAVRTPDPHLTLRHLRGVFEMPVCVHPNPASVSGTSQIMSDLATSAASGKLGTSSATASAKDLRAVRGLHEDHCVLRSQPTLFVCRLVPAPMMF